MAWSLAAGLLPGGAVVLGGEQFSASTTLVVLNVRVTDRTGEHVGNLPRSAFSVRRDGADVPVALFLDEDAPATIGLVLDSSTSMWAVRDDLLAGARAFAAASHPDDELFAMAFNETRHPALPPSAPFTSDRDVLARALSRVVEPRGKTALFDAIRSGLRYAAHGRHPRKALVVVSDGGDNASTSTLAEVVADSQASNVVLYGLALVDPLDATADPDVLRRLSRSSGGEMFQPRGRADLSAALRRIAEDIRQGYVLGIDVPAAPAGTYHVLDVRVSAPGGRNVRVRHREGYRDAAPQPDTEPPITVIDEETREGLDAQP